MPPDRLELQPLAGTRVYFSGHLGPVRDGGNRRRLGDTWALCLTPIEINGRDFPQAYMHLWVVLPINLINMAATHPALQVRGFATVALYPRNNGTLSYGLTQSHDLEVLLTPNEGWQPAQPGQAPHPAQRPPAAAGGVHIPPEVRQRHHQAWIVCYTPRVRRAHQNVIAYRRYQNDPHDQEFRTVIERVRLQLGEGNLPCAEDMNVIYYLIGSWALGQAPRHIRAAFPPRPAAN